MGFFPLSCIGAALPLDQAAGKLHPDVFFMAVPDPVEQDSDCVMSHLAFRNVDRGQTGRGLLCFPDVVDGYFLFRCFFRQSRTPSAVASFAQKMAEGRGSFSSRSSVIFMPSCLVWLVG